MGRLLTADRRSDEPLGARAYLFGNSGPAIVSDLCFEDVWLITPLRARSSCPADGAGEFVWSGRRFRSTPAGLEALWDKVPAGAEVTVVLEPTRNAWAPLAAWLGAKGATVVMVPPEQSADLRNYYNKHTETDRLDSRVLARLPLLHPEGLKPIDSLGPAEPLKRAVWHRTSLVKRRAASMLRLDALVERLGPADADVAGTGDYNKTALMVLERFADLTALKKLGRKRLAAAMIRSSRGAWREAKADELLAAADETLELWSVAGGLDFAKLAEDIALEARHIRQLNDEIAAIEDRIEGKNGRRSKESTGTAPATGPSTSDAPALKIA